ncbi:MAG: HTTM domain-containing protein [Myxococcaceae bacterium]|nr:HTTM domain-containing protein [Myxococcaceae bacterium]
MTRRLFDRIDAAPLVYARMVFGACMAIEVFRFFEHGWVAQYFVRPTFFFSYPGFEWVKPLPGIGMYVLFAVAGVAAVGVATGKLYRVSALVLAIVWSWVFLCDQTNYLNHGYLLCILAWLFACVPAATRDATAPRWAVLLVVGQLGLVYVFGAVAKIDGDWFSGDVARFFLARTDVTQPLAESKPGRIAFATCGFLFDLLIVPGLLWRRTRPFATAAAAGFHLSNAYLFQIGVFPWVMLALTPVFYPASFARRLLRITEAPGTEAFAYRPWVVAAFVLWFAVQVALPLRHWVYPGQVNWTEEGHNFSWHMKLRVKRGETTFRVGDQPVDVRDVLSRRQAKKMTTRPEMIRQLARELSRQHGGAPIYVDAFASLNGRPMQRLIDPTVDLSREERTLGAARWIVPLDPTAQREAGDDDDSE